ncbi:MAG: mechanosensitive ion channel [Myxococcales bacterium]|nr:mechanosensitive ion channel [Myxococcales bacterium]
MAPPSAQRLRRLLSLLLFGLACVLAGPASANPQPGLSKPPPGLDRSTPQRTVDFFLTATREGNFDNAAYALDLRSIPATQEAKRGAELARELRYVLDRALQLDLSEVSDDEQGRPEDGALNETLGKIPLNSSQVSIRLQRVPVAGGGAVWVFSRGTVAAIPDLYAEHGPGEIGRYLPGWAHRISFLQLAVWQWFALLLASVVSLLVALIATRFVLKFANKLAARTANKFDDALVGRLRGPLRLLLSTWLLSVLMEFTKPSIPAEGTIGRLVGTLLIAGFVWLTMRVVHVIADTVLSSMTIAEEADQELVRHGQQMRVKVARQAINGVVFFIGLSLALTQFEVVKKVGVSLLASAGVLTVVIGFAAQKSVANLLAGIQITVAQPIRIGDRVNISGDVGWVEEITLSYVTMKTWDGRRRVFPITFFLENQFENWTKNDTQKTTIVMIHTDYRVPVEKVRQKLEAIVESRQEWDREAVRLVVYDATQQTIQLRATASAEDAGKAFDLGCAIREQLIDYLQGLEGGKYLPRTRVELPGATDDEGDASS